jgi:acetyl esterase/lipase
MLRIRVAALALILLPLSAIARQAGGAGDPGDSGAMSLAELRREPIEFQLDIPYADSTSPRHRLDIYLPRDRKLDILPVIAFLHGGGWMQGDKADGARRLLPFVRTGHYIGVSVGYRLSGDARWPAPIHDAKAAVRWIRGNASKFGVDPDRIGAWGRNAGGHLALMLGVAADVPALEGDIGLHQGVSSRIGGVVNFFGIADLRAAAGEPAGGDRAGRDEPAARLIGGPVPANPDAAAAASPVTYITSNDAPVLTVHGNADLVVPYDQAVRLDAALRRAGVPSYFVTVDGGGHGDFGTAADDRVKMFFDRYLRGQNVLISTAAIAK